MPSTRSRTTASLTTGALSTTNCSVPVSEGCGDAATSRSARRIVTLCEGRTSGLHAIVSVTVPLASRGTGLGGAMDRSRGANETGSALVVRSAVPLVTTTVTVYRPAAHAVSPAASSGIVILSTSGARSADDTTMVLASPSRTCSNRTLAASPPR